MKRNGSYKCAGNLFWLALRRLSRPNVPILQKNIEDLQATWFAEDTIPTEHPYQITVGVTSHSAAQLRSEFGNLVRLSPEEPDIAFILALAQQITNGACEATLRKWKKVALTCSFTFETVGNEEEGFWRSVNLRRRLFYDYEKLSLSTTARIFAVIDFKQMHPTLGNKKLAQEYRAHLQDFRGNTEKPISDHFVDVAVRSYNLLFCSDVCKKMILSDEETHGKTSVFNELSIFDAICKRCHSTADAVWVLSTLKDLISGGSWGPKDFNERTLLGKNQSGRGDLVLWIAKREILQWVLTSWLTCGPRQEHFPNDDVELLKAKIASHSDYRAACGGFGAKVDLTWQAEMHESTRKVLGFLESLIYGTRQDSHLKSAIKTTTVPKDILAQEPFAAQLQEAKDCRAKELPADALKQDEKMEPSPATGAMNFTEPELETLSRLLPEGVTTQDLDEESTTELKDFVQLAAKRVDMFWTPVLMMENREGMQVELKPTPVASFAKKLKAGQNLLIYMDTKVAGESSAQPHCRVPAFSTKVPRESLGALLKIWSLSEMPDNVVVAFADGYRPGLENNLNQVFVHPDGDYLTKSRCLQHISYDYNSIIARKSMSRGIINQVEGLHIYTRDTLTVESRNRRFYDGKTSGTLIGPVVLDTYGSAATWRLSAESKKKLYGKQGKSLAGGPGPQEDRPVFTDGKEPATFWGSPRKLLAELLFSLQAGMVLNLAEVDGAMPMECLLSNIPCVSVVFNADHAQLLHARLVELTVQEMTDPKSPLHDAKL
ncbi:unnamed protein product [Symbiodinium sp. CCMP2592]|nr:unnamed protein product [Symbiodinium sp. CCMP2592]